jgi:Alpha-1,3-glucanase catalytic domain D1/NedA-like, galactose-binding domain/Alpha-1,3-glucanase catalytic domain D2
MSTRLPILAGAVVTVLATPAVVVALALSPPGAAAATGAAQSALDVLGRGATVPFVEYEAEAAATTGNKLAPSRTADTLASEASGRSAVTLSGGQSVEFTLTAPANAVTLHYSIPDATGGNAYTAPLAVYVNGAKSQDLTLTNKYSWFYGSYPFPNSPSNNPHHFYDDARAMFSSTLAIGTRVRFQVDAGVTTTVDTADFESVPAPLTAPAGALSVTSFGADPTGAVDSSAAFDQGVAAASSQGKVLWIPPGNFTVTRHIILNNVTVRGAGPWYSVVHGNGVGFYGNYAPNPSSAVKLYDFAILGEVVDRDDGAQVNAIGGSLGGGSVVSGMWLQHTKVGLWLDGPFDGLTVTGNRILDQTADGLNLHNGISHVTVTNNFVRNTGDDGLAMWSEANADHDNTFAFNTVELPMLANNIAIYGGRDIAVTDNVVSDTQTQGGGLHFANRFNAVLMAGTITVARNTALRTGVLDPNWQFGVGALWFDPQNGALTANVQVTDTDLVDSSYEAIQTVEGSSVSNVSFTNVRIDGTGTFALQLQTGGSATFTNVTAAHVGASNPIYSCLGNAFTINQGSGNSGWFTTTPYCGPWPAPVYTYPGGANPPGGPPPTTPGNPTDPPTTPPTTPPPPVCTVGTGNLAAHHPASTSGAMGGFPAVNATDGDANSYWESTNNAFPQWLQVDLCGTAPVGRVVMKLPPASAWATRTETVAIQGSTDGATWSTLSAARGYTFDPATGNTATATFSAANVRYVRLTVSANTGWPAGQFAEVEAYSDGGTPTTTPPAGNPNLVSAVSASSVSDVYQAGNAHDGNASTYWESANNAFPQWIQADLGASRAVSRLVLKLPPATAWTTRTQTLSVQGSPDGSGFTTLVAGRGYTFDPASGNTVTVTFTAATVRFVRLTFSANTGWPAGQLGELEAYAS